MKVPVAIALVGAGAAGVVLLAVDVTVWSRTARLRRGAAPPGPGEGGVPVAPGEGNANRRSNARTGLATHLAWVIGLFIALAGAGLVAMGRPLGGALLAAGSFVTASGWWGRVVSLEIGPDRLVVRHAIRPPVIVRWSGATFSLAPPRAPPGGWRVRGAPASHGKTEWATLMPSDLLGHETVVAELVQRAGLRWDGRVWRSPSGAETSGPRWG